MRSYCIVFVVLLCLVPFVLLQKDKEVEPSTTTLTNPPTTTEVRLAKSFTTEPDDENVSSTELASTREKPDADIDDDDDEDDLEDDEDDDRLLNAEPENNNEAGEVEEPEGSTPSVKEKKVEEDGGVGSDGDVGNEAEEYEEPKCTFNQFLSDLNVSHYLPKDRISLKTEFDSFQNFPERIRQSPSVNYTIQRLTRLLKMATGLTSRQELRSGLATFMQHNYEHFLELELEAPCMTSLISIIAAIRRSELWAIKFVDSMAKPPPGLLSGVTSFLGDFDQCISVTSPESTSEPFHGQYCLLKPVLPLPTMKKYLGESDENLINETKIMDYLATYKLDNYVKTNPVLKFIERMRSINGRVLNIALCVPDLCSSKQLEISFNRLLYPIIGMPMEIQNSSCWTMAKTRDYTQYLNQYTQFALAFLAIIVSLVILATIIEIYNRLLFCKQLTLERNSSGSATSQTVACLVTIFSAHLNTHRLINPSQPRIKVMDTLRLFVIILIGLSNAFYNPPMTSALRKISQSVPYELLSDPKYFFIRAPNLLNDILVIISGALFLKSLFQYLDAPHDVFSYLLYLIRRWLRLSAPLFGSILFLYLLPMTGFGPLWDQLSDILMPPCTSTSTLTSSLMYYSNWNFIKFNHTDIQSNVVCNPDTWFLSIIFQLNIAFFIIVILAYQSPKSGVRLLCFFVVASLVLNISPRMFHSNTRTFYELTRQPSLWHLKRNFYLYHQNIVQYIGSYSIGLILGYAIVASENTKQFSEKKKRFVLYNCVAFATIVGMFVWVNQFFILNSSPKETSVLLFFSAGRLSFGIALAWLIYVCATKKSPTLNSYLSLPSFQPIARLSYSIFLVQGLVQYHRMYSVKDTYVMTFRTTIESYIIDFLISIIVGYVLYLIFEGPAQRLIEIINSRDPMFDESYSYDLEQKKPPKQKASRRQAEQAMTDVASQCKNNENFPEKSEVISIRF